MYKLIICVLLREFDLLAELSARIEDPVAGYEEYAGVVLEKKYSVDPIRASVLRDNERQQFEFST